MERHHRRLGRQAPDARRGARRPAAPPPRHTPERKGVKVDGQKLADHGYIGVEIESANASVGLLSAPAKALATMWHVDDAEVGRHRTPVLAERGRLRLQPGDERQGRREPRPPTRATTRAPVSVVGIANLGAQAAQGRSRVVAGAAHRDQHRLRSAQHAADGPARRRARRHRDVRVDPHQARARPTTGPTSRSSSRWRRCSSPSWASSSLAGVYLDITHPLQITALTHVELSSSLLSPRRPTRRITLGGVPIGDGAPVTVQSMTTTKTADVDGTLAQIYALAAAGADIVRCTCNEEAAAEGLAHIVPRSPVPIVADIHFHHEMALAALEAGVQGLRLEPGQPAQGGGDQGGGGRGPRPGRPDPYRCQRRLACTPICTRSTAGPRQRRSSSRPRTSSPSSTRSASTT